MNELIILLLLVLVCGYSDAIRVPVEWPKEKTTVSENTFPHIQQKHPFRNPMEEIDLKSSQIEHGFRPIAAPTPPPPSKILKHQIKKQPRRNIRNKYMEYHNRKPNFYKNIEASSGLDPRKQSFRGLPVHPAYGLHLNPLGQQAMTTLNNPIFSNIQEFAKKHEGLGQYFKPTHGSYKIYHPYKAGKMAILNHKRDPQYSNIKNEVNLNAKRLKQYEKDAGNVQVNKDQYLKSPKETESDIFNTNEQHENFPIEHEPYIAQKKPIYYQKPNKSTKIYDRLNNNLKYPIKNHDFIKVIPKAYDPLMQKLGYFRAQQHNKFNDEGDEYPSPQPSYYKNDNGNVAEGADIYNTQKVGFDKSQKNFNNDFNHFTDEHYPNSRHVVNGQSNDSPSDESSADDSDFVPVKMYAQVRKTNTVKHLPREAALEDAETFDEVLNAPRLKQAVKSAKSQVVYSEEGYEDSAYDHAGHQKHASNQEAHKGLLKQKESSAGKYKNDGENEGYGDGGKSSRGEILTKGKKILNDDGNETAHQDAEGYSNLQGEYEDDEVLHPEEYDEDNNEAESEIKERINSNISLSNNSDVKNDTDDMRTEDITILDNLYNNESHHHLNSHSNPQPEDSKTKSEYDEKQASLGNSKRTKRESQFSVPTITLENTYLTNDEIETISREKVIQPRKKSDKKYPYYKSTIIKSLSLNSPIRYAENLSQIPKKSKGGTEFYDSTSSINCPDVEIDLEPIPEHIKETLTKNDNENEEDDEESTSKSKRDINNQKEEVPRLSGLGDKIDCFRQKFFGENPLDNPIFQEDTVGEPEIINEPFVIPTVMLRGSSSEENIYLDTKVKKVPKLIPSRLLNKEKENYTRQKNEKNSPSLFDKNGLRVRPSVLEENHRKSGGPYKYTKAIFTPKQKVNLPDTLNRYIISTDPQTRVYSDVIDNIRTMISTKKGEKSAGFPLFQKTYLNADGSYVSPTISSYKAYTNKEHIDNPSKHIRVIRESPFIPEPYKILNETHVHNSSMALNSTLKQDQDGMTSLGSLLKKIKTFFDTNSQPVKRNAAEKVYKHIRRSNDDTRNTTRASRNKISPTRASINVTENLEKKDSQTRLINNHKDIYTPITVKSSISTEDFLSGKYLDKKRENEGETSSVPNRIISERREKLRPYSPIFDVNEYLPKINNYQIASRFNLSSKFNAREEEEPISTQSQTNHDKKYASITNNATVPQYNLKLNSGAPNDDYPTSDLSLLSDFNHKSVTVPNWKRKEKPSNSAVDKLTKTQVQKNNIPSSSTSPRPTDLKHFDSDDNAKYNDYESDDSDEHYDESADDSAEIFNDNEESNNDDDIRNSDYYDDIETQTTSNEDYTTSVPAVKQVNKEEAISNWKKVLESQRPSDQRSQENDDDASINKPRVLEKTSKKRKTTVITNSRIYKNDQKPTTENQNNNKNLEPNKDRVTPEPEIPQTKNRYTNLQDYPRVSKSNINNKNEDTHSDEHIETIRKPSSRRNHTNRTPLKEIKRYEQNVREEEIINEGSDSLEDDNISDENPGASTLARDVNNLSSEHSSNRDLHSLHSDVEVFRSDFRRNSGPKHGGNYRSIDQRSRKRRPNKETTEMEDLNEGEDTSSRSYRGGNYKTSENLQETPSARILGSLKSALPEMEEFTESKFIKDPSQRMYFYADI